MGVGCRYIRHLFEWETPPTSHPPKNSFTKMGETLPVCREHVHAGRPLVEYRPQTIAFSKNSV